MDDVNINMDEEEFEVLSDDSDDLPSSTNKPVNKTSKINEEELDVLSDASNDDDLPPSSKAVTNKTISKINNPPAKKKYKRIPKPLPFNPGFLSNPKNYPCIAIEDEVILKEGAGPEFKRKQIILLKGICMTVQITLIQTTDDTFISILDVILLYKYIRMYC